MKNPTPNNSLKSRIEAHPLFAGMKPAHLDILEQGASEETFDANKVLFREGEPADRFYLLQSGKIALESHEPGGGTALVQHLAEGDGLGWSWLFEPFVWHFRARAVERTGAIVLNGAHLLVAAEKDHEFGYELIKRVAQVVLHRLHATRKQLLAEQMESALKG
jgi:CRP/FNR family cyclic AMP-dependent transcriptional regulator